MVSCFYFLRCFLYVHARRVEEEEEEEEKEKEKQEDLFKANAVEE